MRAGAGLDICINPSLFCIEDAVYRGSKYTQRVSQAFYSSQLSVTELQAPQAVIWYTTLQC
jgi:hypothetical protein